MLARLQQFITAGLVASCIGWFAWFYDSAPWLALLGSLVIVLGYAGFLSIEFLLLRSINKTDPAPLATRVELLQAWVGEALVAPLVFCWRQPFRHNAIPDNLAPDDVIKGQRGVVFIHGFFCNRGFWNPWLMRLAGTGHAFAAVNLEPIFGSIDDYTPQIEAAVKQVTQVTGLPPLLVCHSMGGLAARAWLHSQHADARVHHIVTIGTPHHGTWLARFSPSLNGQQMRLASDWQAGLSRGAPSRRHALFTCWYSSSDNIVFPTSTAALEGADNRLLRDQAHVQMAFAPQVMDATLALLKINSQ
jgi:triacylglycerol esterase/lipase EstA (alpha/beta hydrolase family)